MSKLPQEEDQTPGRRISHSVLRRTAVLLSFTGLGLSLNLLLLYAATRMLGDAAFGIFYLSLSIVNMLVAPSVILNLFYSQHFIRVIEDLGEDHALPAYRQILWITARWGAVLVIVVAGLMISIGLLAHAQAIHTIILVALIAYTSYIAEMTKVVLQGLHRFFLLGLYFLAWMGLRFSLGLGGLYLLSTAWAGLTGILIATVLVIGSAFAAIGRFFRPRSASAPIPRPIMQSLVPLALSYGLFFAIYFLDVLLAYFLLGQSELSHYSASSVLPKGIVFATGPIVNVLFSAMLRHSPTLEARLLMLLKALGATAAAAGSATVVIIQLSEYLCGSIYGIRLCREDLMGAIVIAALPLCLVRVLVVVQLIRGSSWHPFSLLLPAAGFVVFEFTAAETSLDIGSHFAVFSFLLFGYYLLIILPRPSEWKFLAGRLWAVVARSISKNPL